MASGGARVGTPGTAYGQRTDLNQPVRAGTGQAYGAAGQQRAAQSAIPLPQTPPIPTPQPQQQQRPVPGADGGLYRPSDNPQEPVHAGLQPVGPPDDLDLIRAVFARLPTAGGANLLQSLGLSNGR